MKYQNDYDITVAIRGRQNISLDHEGESLLYGSLEEIDENESVHIYDITNGYFVGVIDWYGYDDDMYQEIHEAIMEYEGDQNE